VQSVEAKEDPEAVDVESDWKKMSTENRRERRQPKADRGLQER